MPPSRNSIDAELPAWDHGKHPSTGWIEPYSCTCTNGTEAECNSGQSCFWFSQGCTIGCKACDGDGRRYPSYDHCPGTPSALKVPTYLDKKWWTANHNATPGSYEDIWRFNPWRAPGHAPVWDACGMAGGSPKEVFNAGAYNTTVHAEPPSLIFLTLTLTLTFHPHPHPHPHPNPDPDQVHAKIGDLGSQVLAPRPSGTVWRRGSVAKARWQLTARHGGGYQYRRAATASQHIALRTPLIAPPTPLIAPPTRTRTASAAGHSAPRRPPPRCRLCPAGSALTEACFQKSPLEFASPKTHRVLFKDSTREVCPRPQP